MKNKEIIYSPGAMLAGILLLSLLPFLMVALFRPQLYHVMDIASYLVFHNIAEFFSVMVSLSIFGVGWFTYDQSKDRHALFLSAAFLAIGLMDFMHTLVYAGMPAFITPNSANKAKSDSLANMSHELRTPLNSVLGFSEILEDELFGKLNEKRHEYLKDIALSGQHLLSLINDILDIAKVETGKMELELSGFSLRDILSLSINMLREKALSHNIKLDLEISPEADTKIEADERKLKQIMFNLLSNAVKFTPDGGSVRVSARKGIGDQGLGIGGENLNPKLSVAPNPRPLTEISSKSLSQTPASV